MTATLEIHIDTKEAEKFLNDLQKKQIPFALARTINESMKDAQRAVKGEIYNKFTVRNRAMVGTRGNPKSGALTRIPTGHFANHRIHKYSATMMNVRTNGSKYLAGEGFIERQIAGKSKTPKGQHIAIPVIGPGMRRLKSGKMSDKKRPRTMDGGNLVKLKAKGKRSAGLYQRMRGDKLRKRYNLVTSARSSRKGRVRYFEVGQKTILRTIHGHWATSLNHALRTAKR